MRLTLRSLQPISRTVALNLGLALVGCSPGADQILQIKLFKETHPPVELVSGDALGAGDKLYMTVVTQRDLHLYVVSGDASDDRQIIYPCSKGSPSRRLRAGWYRLPPPLLGSETFWPVGSVTPRERLLVIASTHPLDRLDAAVRAPESPPCAAKVAAEASLWIDGLTAGRSSGVWVSTFELKGRESHGS